MLQRRIDAAAALRDQRGSLTAARKNKIALESVRARPESQTEKIKLQQLLADEDREGQKGRRFPACDMKSSLWLLNAW